MDTKLVAFAIFALAGAVLFLWLGRRAGQDRAVMAATPTSKAADVATLAPGSIVEVQGILRCADPLTAEFSQKRCAFFNAQISEVSTWYSTNADGKRERNTSTSIVHSNRQSALCVVEDDSGRVALRLDGADIEGDQAVNRTEASLGAALSGLASADNAEYRHTETILGYDIPVYVLGEVQADRAIGKPAKGSANRVFVVSKHSEEERTKELGRSVQLFQWLAAGLGMIGAALLVWARLKGATH